MHEDDSSEMASLQGRFDQIPLEERNGDSDPLNPSDSTIDYDPVLSNSLNSSLTQGSVKPISGGRLDRWRYWLADPKNKPTVRVGQCLGLALIVFIVILIVSAYAHHSDDDIPPVVYSVRLPRSVQPSLYTMALNASLVTQKFSGDMKIDVAFTESTNQILFHQKDLQLSDIYFTLHTSTGLQTVTPVSYGDTKQFDLFAVNFHAPFAGGMTGTLHIRFVGSILPTLAGFYLSKYNDARGVTHTIASTQFESTDARRAFPCFDEPAFKANWSISIQTDTIFEGNEQVVLSNMPLAQLDTIGGQSRWNFATSVRMSSYLVAYCITDFKSKSGKTKNGVPVSVWTAPDKIGQVDVALEAGIAAIDKYEEFFKILYPLPKQDMIGIPNFPVGAMENYGLVTYRESALLIDPASAEAMTEQNIVATVAHELAHQWFGDYVTMSWWTDLWLNEGFASFMEWIGMEAYNPLWHTQSQVILDSQTTAMGLDSSQYSHPVVQVVNDPAEIDALFDSVSYDKGCSLLLMIADILGYYQAGDSSFQTGLHNYLSRHAYGNAASDDLWSALGEAAPKGLPVDLTTFMHKFTKQMGYPLVTVKENAAEDGWIITQKRFLELPYQYQDPALRDSQSDYVWDIPITYSDSTSDSPKTIWFKSSDQQVTIPMESMSDLFLNVGRRGYYRVHYSPTLLQLLSHRLMAGVERYSEGDIIGFIDDSWTLALAGEVKYEDAFGLIVFLNTSSEYIPWSAALSQLGRVKSLIQSKPDDKQRFNQYVVHRLINNNPFSTPPWNGFASHLDNLLQAAFVNALVAYGDTSARATAHQLFTDFMKSNQPVPVNIRDGVYRVGIEEGGLSEWNFLFDRYTTSLDPSESRRILRALTRSRQPDRLTDLMNWSIDPTKIKSQDTSRIIIYCAQNEIGKELAWNWIKANYDVLFKLFGSASFTLSELITRVIGLFQTEKELNEAKQFFENKNLGTASRAILQAYEIVDTNIYWLKERYEEFSQALKMV